MSTLTPGQLVAGRYRVLRAIGEGGMGAVYEAEHVELHRRVALKVLLPDLARNAEVVYRFLREARTAAAIGHPGIVEVFDLGTEGDTTFIAMEKLEGEELAHRIERQHPLPIADVVRIVHELCDAVAAAHDAGVVHRDLKPQNVFLSRKGKHEIVKVLDFGIAKLIEPERGDVPITRSGQIYGTPLYMAPEQLRNSKDVDARTDVYAIGAILYHALTGRPPFHAESFAELVVRVLTEALVPVSALRPDVAPEVAAIVERAMSRDLAVRPRDAGELRDLLGTVLAQGRMSTTPAPPMPASRPSNRPGADMSLAGTVAAGTADPAPASQTGPITGTGAATPWSVETPVPPAPVLPAPAPAGRSPLRFAIPALLGLAVLGGIGGLAYSNLIAPSEPTPVAQPPAVPDAGPPPRDAGPPIPAEREVAFETEPSGGTIRVADRECTVPCRLTFPTMQPIEVVARLEGYEDETRSIAAPLPERVTVWLTRPVPTRTKIKRRPQGRQGDDPPDLLPR